MDQLKTALEAYKPELIETFSNIVRRQFEDMVGDLGVNLRGVHNSWKWAKIYTNTVKFNLKSESTAPVRTMDSIVYSINEEQLAKNAAKYADAVVESWEAKIRGKMGELEEADVKRLTGMGFLITGKKGENDVVIEQHMILNVSKLGTLFNQFPARIRVNGKAISETKYKQL